MEKQKPTSTEQMLSVDETKKSFREVIRSKPAKLTAASALLLSATLLADGVVAGNKIEADFLVAEFSIVFLASIIIGAAIRANSK